MMTAGVFGTLVSVEGDTARVEIADGVIIEIATAAVASVEQPSSADHDATARAADDDREEG